MPVSESSGAGQADPQASGTPRGGSTASRAAHQALRVPQTAAVTTSRRGRDTHPGALGGTQAPTGLTTLAPAINLLV